MGTGPIKGAIDVLVVGSGAAGLVTALRAAALGLDVVVIEKAHRYGGTSALSGGGLWVPNHGLADDDDSPDLALAYLRALCGNLAHDDRLTAYVEHAPSMLRFLMECGINFAVFPGYPDYFADLPGALTGRAVFPTEIDGGELGEGLDRLRDQPLVFKLFNRYAVDLSEAFALSIQSPGWRRTAFNIVTRYWLDFPMRRRTRRDRRLTMGNALVGGLYKALRQRGVPVVLNTRLEQVSSNGSDGFCVEVSRNGTRFEANVRSGVVLAAGGFEQNQNLRDRYFPVPSEARWSLTPRGANEGDAIRACELLSPAMEFMEYGWWTPTMQLPSSAPNVELTHQMFLDHRHPHSVCVNRLGRRFVNEACSYDLFGIAMIEDQRRSGANVPCWMVFDSQYRAKYGCGGILPSSVVSDAKLPPEWIDAYLYRADSIAEVAGKIDLEPDVLAQSVAQMNEAAATGVDSEFGRGNSVYDRYFGDHTMAGNPCLGTIAKPPFYAVRIDLGDIGTKGGFKVNQSAQVLSSGGEPIKGLYAVGNCAASPFGNAYPGAGGTLGPATVFGYVAAEHLGGSLST